MNPGVCPVCGTDLDHEEIIEARDYIEAFCCTCGTYRRKRRAVQAAGGTKEDA